MPIVEVGKGLQGYGWNVGQHKAFGPVGRHATNSFHYSGEAIDVTDHRADDGPEYAGGPALHWKERTRRLMERARQLGSFDEVLGPGDADHGEHVHLAKRKDRPAPSAQQLEWLATGRWRRPEGGYDSAMPNPANPPSGTSASASYEPPAQPAVPDWRTAASDPQRSRDPASAAYWQREDMRQWAAANPHLAAPLLAVAGVKPPASAAAVSPPPASAGDSQQAFKPAERGALNGVRVGGPPRPALQPYFFELHADAAASAGGRTGFIGSYLDRDNPLFQQINQAYGNYGENHSRQWRGGDLGAPRHGLSIIETRTAGGGMADPDQQRAAAQKLLDTLLADADVRSGARPIHLFAGHADTTRPDQQGAAGGDAPEKVWNTGVMRELRTLAQQSQLGNVQFHEAIVDNDNAGRNTNWARAKALREQWLQQSRSAPSP
jgi:hypothetical protein